MVSTFDYNSYITMLACTHAHTGTPPENSVIHLYLGYSKSYCIHTQYFIDSKKQISYFHILFQGEGGEG
jgi:hypothetical protein